jgi:small conductance mechanosensitive channel
MQDWLTTLFDLIPAAGLSGLALIVLLVSNEIVRRRGVQTSITFQFIRLLVALSILVAVILLLPISDQTQGQMLSLLGVLLTAVIALSSTTFVSNMMAGLMLQASNTIRPGDFVRVNDQFGRVTRRSLLQTKIQTEWRDIATLPNILLINNPVTVLHRDGTIISAEISLGYDTPYTQAEELLKQAAEEAGLEETFVLAQELLDHAVSYRVAGFLTETKNLLTARSNLRKKVLEVLHGQGVEVASPSIMMTRPVDPKQKIMPATPVRHQVNRAEKPSVIPEDRIFDKAEEAANLEELKTQLESIQVELKTLREEARNSAEDKLPRVNARIEHAREQEAGLKACIEKAGDKPQKDG